MKQSSPAPYTKKMLRIEAFMKVLLASSAFLIIGVLIILIGYLSFRGLFIRHEVSSAVLPDYQEEFFWPDKQMGSHRLWSNVGLGKLRADKLHDILSGKEKNWVELAESDEKLTLLLTEAQLQNIQSAHASAGLEWDEARTTKVLPDTEAVVQALLETPGALAILPAEWNDWRGQKPPKPISLAVRSLVLKTKGETTGQKMPLEEAKSLLEESPQDLQVIDYNWVTGETSENLIQLEYREYEILKLSFLLEGPAKNGKVGGISTLLLSSVILIITSLLWAVPLGLAVAVFLAEYANNGKKKSHFSDIINIAIQTLSGIPSIIFGLFGSILFVPLFGISLLSGAATLVLILLPTIILTAREALLTVPRSYIEASLGLGAQKWYTILHISIPSALSGILAGIILAIGRALGETAALIYTLGTGYQAVLSRFPQLLNDWPVLWQDFWLNPSLAKIVQVVQDYPLVNLHSSLRSLSLHLYWMTINGISLQKGFSTAFVLIFLIVLLNMGARKLLSRFSSKGQEQH